MFTAGLVSGLIFGWWLGVLTVLVIVLVILYLVATDRPKEAKVVREAQEIIDQMTKTE